MKWSKITLANFKQLEHYDKTVKDETDKLLYSVCAIYGISEHTLDTMQPKKATKKILAVQRTLETAPKLIASKFIGLHHINYNIASLTFGQYVEIAYFLQDGVLNNAHLIVASCAKGLTNTPHSKKAEYFLHKSIESILGSAMQITTNFNNFNKGYKGLFGVQRITDDGREEEVKPEPFNKQYGWIFSATQVAEHERITLDAAFQLPVIQALNDLSYLKSKGKYLEKQIKSVK